ncbi:hypothetical protein N7532_010853 [Penicillium argentinense]|uniref:protein disulfide-isomerase n=1 Tax=Penicillium argentinense TaxID=1131581 RepID=A0A9W9EQE3_9EURO|nr:uncharacterized protein N7532_010853 [Penicillium argentinense]KAJ5086082.1 hypothetical protein N7532_010853 [Penicillium argentinense]
MLPQSALLLVASLLAALPAKADGIYTRKSPVLQLNQKTYGSHIANSNYTSIVEFYAPWCGHCQNLKPAYEKAAQSLDGLARVAAVNCDEDENKPFCGQMGVQGFPTLKIVTPGKKPGKPRVEDYQGARSAKAIVDAVVDRIPNHVKRATDKDLDRWLGQNEERPKAILFTEKGTTSALIRALAIDYLGAIDVAQVRSKESASVEKFGISDFPKLVVLPSGEGAEIQVYDGELKKQPITEFLTQFASPNPDATGKAASTSANNKPKSKPKAKTPPKQSSTEEDAPTDAKEETETKPAQVPEPPKSPTCVLVLLPETISDEAATTALSSVAEIAHKHSLRGAHLFPVHSVPMTNTGSQTVRTALGLEGSKGVEIIAVNARRGWWRRYGNAEDFGIAAIEGWFDTIRLGEGAKEKLPEGLVRAGKTEPTNKEKEKEEKEEVEHDEL